MTKIETCIRCNLQGDNRREGDTFKILCLVDSQWYDESHSCEEWQQVSRKMNRPERVALAKSIFEREDAERRHKEILREQGITRKHQTKLVLFGFLGGIIGGLILGYLLGLWGLSPP